LLQRQQGWQEREQQQQQQQHQPHQLRLPLPWPARGTPELLQREQVPQQG
jgi:hypothetical protein